MQKKLEKSGKSQGNSSVQKSGNHELTNSSPPGFVNLQTCFIESTTHNTKFCDISQLQRLYHFSAIYLNILSQYLSISKELSQ